MIYQIYGKDNCKFCTQAESILIAKNLPYQYFKLGMEFTREELLELFPGAKTFPQIRIEYQKMSGKTHEYVGGFAELQASLVANQN